MVVEVKRNIKILTEQATIPGRAPEVEGHPMKLWSIDIQLLDEAGNAMTADIFKSVTYNLHPSFANPNQTFTEPPFRCQNEGWGEFEMSIDLMGVEKGGKHTIVHDLNFAKAKYETKHVITFKNPNAALLEILKKSGPVPGEGTNGDRKKEAKPKKKPVVDMEKLAEGMTSMTEDDLLHVVQIIHDNKTEDTYTKNDVELGEFHVDLYTLPDNCIKLLWDFVSAKA